MSACNLEEVNSVDEAQKSFIEAMGRNRERKREAVRRILEVSAELHLTWSDFEDVIQMVKKTAQISMPSSNDRM